LVLLITLGGSIIGYLLTAYAVSIESYPLFLFSRLVTGVCEGNISIARAMAVELHPVINRTKALSLVYATVYGGWLLGPLAGGYLMLIGTAHVFIAAAFAIMLCALVVMIAIKDNKEQILINEPLLKTINRENSFRLLRHQEVRPIFLFYFIYTLGLNAFYEFYPVWFVEIHHFGSDSIAWVTVLMTSIMILSSVLFTTKIVNYFGTYSTLITSVIAMGILLVVQPFSGLNIVYYLFSIIGFLIALNNTVTPTYMSTRFAEFGHGKVMGLQTSIFCLTNVIISLLGSVVAVFSITATMVMSGVLVLFAIGWFYCIQENVETVHENI